MGLLLNERHRGANRRDGHMGQTGEPFPFASVRGKPPVGFALQQLRECLAATDHQPDVQLVAVSGLKLFAAPFG